jgi:BirA family biotin operon repressor/biotin-[acetyl-CoA-carboxylase] ligase
LGDSGASDPLFDAYRSRLVTLGRQITFEHDGMRVSGTADDVSPDGGLIVRLDDGTTIVRYAGEVSPSTP